MEEFFKQSLIKFDTERGLYKPPPIVQPVETAQIVQPVESAPIIGTIKKTKKKIDPDDYDPDEIIDAIIDMKPSMTDTRKLLKKFVNRFDDDDD